MRNIAKLLTEAITDRFTKNFDITRTFLPCTFEELDSGPTDYILTSKRNTADNKKAKSKNNPALRGCEGKDYFTCIFR